MKTVKRLLLAALAVAVLSVSPSLAAGKQRLLLGTSSVGGTYYVLGGAWAKLLNEKIPTIDVSVEVTGGPASNMPLISGKEMELGFLTTWLAGEGFNGVGAWTGGKKYQDIRAIFPMYASVLHIYTLEKLPIKTVYDFAGKHVTAGAPGATSDLAAKALLQCLGIKVSKYSSLPTGTAVNTLRDGNCDGGFAVTGAPGPFMLDLESTHAVRHISLPDQDIEKILKANPYWSAGVIPKGTYKHQTGDTKVITFWNVAAAHKDLDDETIYKIVKTTFEGQKSLLAAAPDMAQCVPANIVKSTIPVHKGALKYYKEVGIKIPDALIPKEAK